MSSTPTLSVVIPNYNHGEHLRGCLDAVLAQSYQPTEVIVVDDGSTDNSAQILAEYASRHPIVKVFLNERNKGVAFTINRGLRMASGDYISLLGADDQIMPGLYEKSIGLLSQHTQAAISATIVEFRDMTRGLTYHQGTQISNEARYFSPEEVIELSRQNRLIVFTSTMIHRREALLAVDGYDENHRWHTDWFTCFVPALRHGFCFVPEILGEYRVFPNSFSKKGMRVWSTQTKVLRNILDTLLLPKYKDVSRAIKQSAILAPFGKEMMFLLLTNRRYWQFLSLLYFKNAVWWISRIELKKMMPPFLIDIYFTWSGHKLQKTTKDDECPAE